MITGISAQVKGPHQGQPLIARGAPLASAQAAMVMVHGRGATAQDILALTDALMRPGIAYLAPQAAGRQWYPNRFLSPIASNEPWLSSALASIGHAVSQAQAHGIPKERIYLLGFSQGACLTLEFARREGGRFAGIFGLSGALIGADDEFQNQPAGALERTTVFLGCSESDEHIPSNRVLRSAEIFKNLGASVTVRLYPGGGHMINADELDFIRSALFPASESKTP